jgi:hypothetical protein
MSSRRLRIRSAGVDPRWKAFPIKPGDMAKRFG